MRSSTLTATLLATLLLAAVPARSELSAGYRLFAGGDYARALDVLRPLAERDDPFAAYYVGLMLLEGRAVARNEQAAASWLARAARQGHAAAQLQLALAYESGFGVPQDYQLAARWMSAAAEGGNADAQYHLGRFYRDGRGVVQSDELSFEWVRRSVEYDSSHERFLDALLYLGAALEWGRGVRFDLVEAYKWFALAASYSIDDLRIHDEAARAMDALTLRLTAGELEQARRAAQLWRDGKDENTAIRP